MFKDVKAINFLTRKIIIYLLYFSCDFLSSILELIVILDTSFLKETVDLSNIEIFHRKSSF